MIRELIVHKCICSKCSHTWTTKTHDLPARCSKCNVKSWNDDYEAVSYVVEVEQAQAPPVVPQTQVATQQASKFDGIQMNDAMAKFLTRAAVNQSLPEPVEEDWQFTNDKPQYETPDDVYRKQFLGKRTRTVKVDADNLDEIVRVIA